MPGAGHVRVNVGTGNLVIGAEDMAFPHAGLPMDFHRTYNSQSSHDVNGTDGTPPSLYGNGWTSTWDMHIAISPSGGMDVYDEDGAQYHYAINQVGGLDAPPGQHATLTSDGACGYVWTKKDGTIAYFYGLDTTACGATNAGYNGRLHQLIGRNANTTLTLVYSWLADSGASGTITKIVVSADSGAHVTLDFMPVNNHQLLRTLTWPDGTTTTTYEYDANGNLVFVSHPYNTSAPPGSNGFLISNPQEGYSYTASASNFYLLTSALSPNFNRSSSGGYLRFVYTSASTPGQTNVSELDHVAYVDPTVPDGTNAGPIQAMPPANGAGVGGPAAASAQAPYLSEYYVTGVNSPTFSDSDLHETDWTMYADGTARQNTAVDVGGGIRRISSKTWDSQNNLTATVEPRGFASGASPTAFETDYAYDANGNLIAKALPAITAADGSTYRPTTLISYEQYNGTNFNNVAAYCDPAIVHSQHLDWTARPTPPPPGQGLCPQTPVAYRSAFTHPATEPYGRITSQTSPATTTATAGYNQFYFYDVAAQGGVDHGLPTSITGDSISQPTDPVWPQRQPAQTLWYDANGNVVCLGSGSGTSVFAYDAMGRMTNAGDPDDSFMGAGPCGRTVTQTWNTTTTIAYNPSGTVASVQAPLQKGGSGSYGPYNTSFAYDSDGNTIVESHYHAGILGNTQKFYDGADRLVEVIQPRQSDSQASTTTNFTLARNDLNPFAWMTRYFYDLTAGGTPQGLAGQAYGNLYTVQEYNQFGTRPPPPPQYWTSYTGWSYDALNRTQKEFNYAYKSPNLTSFTYDENGQVGLLTSVSRASVGEVEKRAYDADGNLVSDAYTSTSGGPGSTPSKSYQYDANMRIAKIVSPVDGSVAYAYDAQGNVTGKTTADSPNDDTPGTIGYSYYPDGTRRAVGFIASGAGVGTFSQAAMFTYGYRPDGQLTSKKVQLPASVTTALGNGLFTWSYTAGGRILSRNDPFTGAPIPGAGTTAAARLRSSAPAALSARAHVEPGADAGISPTLHASPAQRSAYESPLGRLTAALGPASLRRLEAPAASGKPIPAGRAANALAPATGVVAGSGTFAPISAAYGQRGELISYGMPNGQSYNSISHDVEGSVLAFYGYGGPLGSTYPEKLVENAYNVRGELTAQHFFDDTSALTSNTFNKQWPYFASQPENGAMITLDESLGTPPNYSEDPVANKILDYQFGDATSGFCKASPATEISWLTDGAGRDYQEFIQRASTGPQDCPAGYYQGHATRGFDFGDHLVSWTLPAGDYYTLQGQTVPCYYTGEYSGNLPVQNYGSTNQFNYRWGPEGNLVGMRSATGFKRDFHWDGDELLFATDDSGHLDDVQVGEDADVNGQGAFVIRDRDWAGSLAMSHNASGYSKWLPPNPSRQGCTPNQPYPASAGYSAATEPFLSHPAFDGYADGTNVFQGQRAYDASKGQWMTPDSNPGSVDDPVSQKPFAWNRNDPYGYTDRDGRQAIPYGFVYTAAQDPRVLSIGGVLIHFGIRFGGAVVPYVTPVAGGVAFGVYAFVKPIPAGKVTRCGYDFCPVTKLEARSSSSGENGPAARGREMHKKFIGPPGGEYEFRIPFTNLKIDYYNKFIGKIIEMKPNNARAIQRGVRQVQRYAEELRKLDDPDLPVNDTEVTTY